MSSWDEITAKELRIAAKVADAYGGPVMVGAASAWRLRADLIEEEYLREQLRLWSEG